LFPLLFLLSLPKWYEINKAETRQVLIYFTVIYLQQLDWNSSNVCLVGYKVSIHLHQQHFFSMRMCTAYITSDNHKLSVIINAGKL